MSSSNSLRPENILPHVANGALQLWLNYEDEEIYPGEVLGGPSVIIRVLISGGKGKQSQGEIWRYSADSFKDSKRNCKPKNTDTRKGKQTESLLTTPERT